MASPAINPSGNPFLGPNPPEGDDLNVHAVVAIGLLGLDGKTFDGNDLDIAKSAIAMQIRFQHDHGVDPRKYTTYQEGSRIRIFSRGAQIGIDPLAEQLASTLVGDTGGQPYTIIQNRR